MYYFCGSFLKLTLYLFRLCVDGAPHIPCPCLTAVVSMGDRGGVEEGRGGSW